MRAITGIFLKEIRLYLTTWISYVLFGAFIGITGYLFYRAVVEFQGMLLSAQRDPRMLQQMNLTDAVMLPVLATACVVLIFLIPVLSMRLFAEERRGKTLELLLTAPVRPFEIVAGKYLSGLAMVALMIGLTVIFPLALQLLGEGTVNEATSPLDWRTLGVSYLGIFLFGAACLAVGMLTSSITESQLIAVVISFLGLLMLWILDGQGEGTVGKVLNYLAITPHLESFLRGIIKLSDVVYYLSLAFIGLFLTHRVVEAQRWR